ncbi:MAG: proline--tRNA ligase, partial [Gammaproteobacteria bacterium]
LEAFFRPQNEAKPEIHCGFALVYCKEDEQLEERLKQYKLTHRCYPLNGEERPGPCVFTGEMCARRAILAKAY